MAAACTAEGGGNPADWGRASIEPGDEITPPAPDTSTQYRGEPVKIITEPDASNWFESGCRLSPEIVERTRRGFYPGRSPDVVFVPREPNFFGTFASTSHSGPWNYLQDVPFVFYGPGYIRPLGEVRLRREVTLADLAPTLAELLGVNPPEGVVGRPLTRILVPERERAGRPKLILTVVWDGGGWNVLDAWPRAWPTLARLTEHGAGVLDATVGSSPSVTPAVHTTIGTGTFPKQHGVIGLKMRIESGRVGVGPFGNKSPEFLRVPSLADTYDLTTGNEAKIGMLAYKSWHLGMIGHGAMFPGGDRDIGIITDQDETQTTNPSFYRVPRDANSIPGLARAVNEVDRADGTLDDAWMGHDVLDDPSERRDTPAWVLYQTRLLEELIEREGFGRDDVPDLFYTNYKQIDEVGHNWNMINPEMREVLEYSDAALADLVRLLNRTAGKGNWVMVVTADHGQGPAPLNSGAWPIQMSEVRADVGREYGADPEEIVRDVSPIGYWIDRSLLRKGGGTMAGLADFFVDYRLEDNVTSEEGPPDDYGARLKEPIFEASWPSSKMRRVLRCSRRD